MTRDDGTKHFQIEAYCLGFNGNVCGEAVVKLSINEFRGARKIDLLPAYPLLYHGRPIETRARLIEYGRRFASLAGVHHRNYEGKAFYIHPQDGLVIKTVKKSRIMVDASFFHKRNPNYKTAQVQSTVIDLSSFFKVSPSSEQRSLPLAVVKDLKALSEHDALICSPTVLGYSLDLKIWLEFAVGSIDDIEWNASSFSHLALPDGHKRAVQALCVAHLDRVSHEPLQDFVAGKGRGLIFLLHGPPGVGKTMTVETISERVRQPLYTVSAGDLGTTPDMLEDRLSNALALASHWRAVLLLDEADVFVERRSTSDVHRNALVSIFLRKLEYYEGILFFTTNRVRSIDEAIASRIHLPLKYDDLSEAARRQVWETQLVKAITKRGSAKCGLKHLDDLARKRLNGREITNVVSTARAMADYDDKIVDSSYLAQAISLSAQFQMDFKGAGSFDAQNSYV